MIFMAWHNTLFVVGVELGTPAEATSLCEGDFLVVFADLTW